MKLNIGLGGIPLSTKNRSTLAGIKRVAELGLDLMEVEFVRGVNLNAEVARAISLDPAVKQVNLTIHGPYFLNLASDLAKTFHSSISYLVDSLYIGGLLGAKSVTFHAGFFGKKTGAEVFTRIQEGVQQIGVELAKKAEKTGIPITSFPVLAPELTGKPSQFGDLNELMQLIKKTELPIKLKLCVDFAHYFARTGGVKNGYDQFREIFKQIETKLGKEYLTELHMHISAINYGPKGERNHLTFLQSWQDYLASGIELPELEADFQELVKKGKTNACDFLWRDVLRAIKDAGVGGYLVCESPILELDALLLQRSYQELWT